MGHDVFASLMRRPRRLSDGNGLAGYLTVCARNRAFDLLRARKRRRDHAARQTPAEPAGEDPTSAPERSEEAEILIDAVARLPQPLREVLALKIWGELPFREIAGLHDISPSTAHARYGEALDRLRAELARRGVTWQT